jgi:hypothetical protein
LERYHIDECKDNAYIRLTDLHRFAAKQIHPGVIVTPRLQAFNALRHTNAMHAWTGVCKRLAFIEVCCAWTGVCKRLAFANVWRL